jgi:DNA mismatch endonuclease, patch repair protein
MAERHALARKKSILKSRQEQRIGRLPVVAGAGESASGFDIMSQAMRSALMGRIRGRDTGPELTVRRLLHAMGYRYRLQARELPGRPDIVFRNRRVTLFIHGCFWHRHDCGLAYVPKTRPEFWQRKFEGNVARDRRVQHELTAAGWRVITIWECQLDDLTSLAKRLARQIGPPGAVIRRAPAAPKQSKPARKTRGRARLSRP